MIRSFFSILFLFPLFLQAQTILVGRVITKTDRPVQGVHIFCLESQQGTVSDSSGHFELECGLPCTLEFSHLNYIQETYYIQKNNAPFVITLRNKLNNLQEVIVKAQITPGHTYSSKKNIEMIPTLLGEQDLLKYLATMPGVVTTNALDPGIYVRGGNSWENGFLTNGIEIASPDHLTGILSTFDPYILSNSTLYKSGFPARYSNFLSSYIDMQPNAGNKRQYEGELTAGLVSSALKVRGPIVKDHTSFALSFRTSYLQTIAKLYNNSIKDPKDQNYMPEYSFQDVTFHLDSRWSEKWRTSGFGIFTTDQLHMKLNETLQYDFDWHTVSGNFGAYYTPDLQNTFHFRIGAKSVFSKGNAAGIIPMGGGNRHYSILGKTDYSHIFSEQVQLNAGIKFEQARFETANKPNIQNNILIKSSDNRFNIIETYLDINFHINKHLTFYGGLNYQHYNGKSQINEFSPRVKLSFSFNSFSLWADYTKTAQYLSLYPYFTVKTPVDIWYPLDKNRQPAICHQFSIGLQKNLSPDFFFYVGAFYKKMRHVKDFSSGLSTEYTVLTDNMIEGKGHAKGVEFNLTYQGKRFYTRMNYTLSESKRKFPEINQNRPFNPPFDVKHNILIHSSIELTSRLSFNALWTYTSGTHTTFPVGTAIAHNITDSQNRPVLIPVYTDRYNYRLPSSHRLDLDLNYTIPYKHFILKGIVGTYNTYNHANPSFVYFMPETNSDHSSKFIPKSKVILPFIPYISLRLNFR